MSALLSNPDAPITTMWDLALGRPVLAHRGGPLAMVVRANYLDDAKPAWRQRTVMLRTSDGPLGVTLFVDPANLQGGPGHLPLRTVACQWCRPDVAMAADLLSDNGVPVCAHHGRATRKPAAVWLDDAVAAELHRLGMHQ